jgi:hypothetical protein
VTPHTIPTPRDWAEKAPRTRIEELPSLREHIIILLRENGITTLAKAVQPAALKTLKIEGKQFMPTSEGKPFDPETHVRPYAAINSTMKTLIKLGKVRTAFREGVNNYYLPQ